MAMEILAIFALLLLPAFAEHAKIRTKAMKGFNLVFSSGAMFLLALGFGTLAGIPGAGNVSVVGEWLFDFVGWVFLLVGSIMVALDMSKM